MKTQHLVLLIIILAILTAVAIWKSSSGNKSWRDGDASTAETILDEDFDTEAIKSIKIESESSSVEMHRTDSGWTVADRFDYPANIQELARFIMELADTKIAQTVPIKEEQAPELGLTTETGAVTATLADSDGKILKTVIFGKKVEKESDEPSPMAMYGIGGNIPLGRYIRTGNDVFLVANTFALVDDNVQEWLDKDFFRIQEMKSATLSHSATPVWTVSRNTKEADLVLLADIPENKENDTSKLSAIKSAFSWIRFNDIAAPDADAKSLGMDDTKLLTVLDFDGTIYTITFGKPVEQKQFMKIAVDWKGNEIREPGENEKPEDKEKLDADFAANIQTLKAKAKSLNDKLSPWIYEVSNNALAPVDKSLDELLKDKPAPEKKEAPVSPVIPEGNGASVPLTAPEVAE